MSENTEATLNEMPIDKDETLRPEKITMRDINSLWFRWWWVVEIPHSFDRYIAASFMFALKPILKKLYKTKEDLKAAYQRHLVFYNTQANWGAPILGIIASLEEQKANEEFERGDSDVSDDTLNNMKAGLMGPLAGIGDSIDEGVVQYIFIAMALPWAQEGSVFGSIFPFVAFAGWMFFFGWYLCRSSFKLGRQVAADLVSTSTQQLLEGLSILGLFMMGILGGNYVNITSSFTASLGNENAFVLQESLDSILPGLLPIVTILGVYFYFRRKEFNVTKAIVALTVILGVLAWFGIL